jgi:ubiquinone/menaquinone biosynthesis C-methylase UbiE
MGVIHDFIFGKKRRVCPWYYCSLSNNINILRKFLHNPEKILSGLIRPGDTIIDVGPGQGYFTFPMAKMTGKNGKVIAIDIQAKMLSILENKAKRDSMDDILLCKLVSDTNYGFTSEIDFALAFWMVHEVPDQELFFKSIYQSLKPGGKLLIAEPFVHVTTKSLDETQKFCEALGFRLIDSPKIFFSRSILLQKV